MSVNKYNSQTGELTTIASGQRTWIGTKEAYEQQKQAGTLPTDCLICITNDEDDTIADAVTNGDPRAVTSNAVYDTIAGKLPAYRNCWLTAKGTGSASVPVDATSAYLVTVRCYVSTNANSRTTKIYFAEVWAGAGKVIEITSLDGNSSQPVSLAWSGDYSTGYNLVASTTSSNTCTIVMNVMKLLEG